MFPEIIGTSTRRLIEGLLQRGAMIATAESCTGGLIAAALTEIPGSSAVVYGGYVTYADAAKQNMIGVSDDLLAEFGAVSEQVARAMSEGVMRASDADIAVAVTGIAGPGGGTPEKPVGLVHFACSVKSQTVHLRREFQNLGRQSIRLATVEQAMELVLETISDQP